MLTLTTTAADVIRKLSTQSTADPSDSGVRISSQPDTAGALMLSVADGPETTDKIIESEGARVFLDPTAASLLDDKSLDADVDGQGGIAFLITDQRP